jgi:hypothetical protein
MEEKDRKEAEELIIAEMEKLRQRPLKTPKEIENHRKRMDTLAGELSMLRVPRR